MWLIVIMKICLYTVSLCKISFFIFYNSGMFLIGYTRFTQGLYLTSNHLHICFKTLICSIKVMATCCVCTLKTHSLKLDPKRSAFSLKNKLKITTPKFTSLHGSGGKASLSAAETSKQVST